MPEIDMEEEPQKPVTLEPESPVKNSHWRHWHRFKSWYVTHKQWSVPATILIILAILSAVPWVRYNTAGQFIKKNFTVHVTDSSARTPVSGAAVKIGSISALTNGNGQAVLQGVKAGNHSVIITKKYYQNGTTSVVVPFLSEKSVPDVLLKATGRQVKISVTNLITKKALSNVDIKIADVSAKTDSLGNALLVVPVNASTQKAALSLSGYNNSSVTVKVSNTSIQQNSFGLTPSGSIYFLSNRTGSLDLMKANLDGSSAVVVVPGTASEDVSDTSLLQSSDGKYVALIAKRSDSDPTPQLYVLSAADDKLLATDTGNAIFQAYSWVGDTLIYSVQRQDLPLWQQGISKIKAYNALTGGTTLLDQSAGSDSPTNANEYYSEIMVASNYVVYAKIWQGNNGVVGGKQDSLQVINIDGQGHQNLASYNTSDNIYFSQHSPDTLYIWQNNYSSSTDTYFQYTAGSSVKPISLNNQQFYDGANTYYYSPSGNQTFWVETRDGKQTVLVGDQTGGNASTVSSLSEYRAYGWYSDQYLLLTKNSNELYIMGVKGGTPVKITDYQASGIYSYGGR